MKRTLVIAVAMVAILVVAGCGSSNHEQGVDYSDAYNNAGRAFKIYCGELVPTQEDFDRLDLAPLFNHDGVIDYTDVVVWLRISNGAITSWKE